MNLWTLGIRACKSRTSTAKHRRSLHHSSRSLLPHTVPFDAWAQPGPEMNAMDATSLAKRTKWDDLMDSLSRDRANPSRVWNIYLELGSVLGFHEVPFQVQQQVLRKCVPRTAQLRIAAARRLQAGNTPNAPHIYETRLQTLIGHMRASGQKPELDDYNFILEQFAAVGHQNGARQVFQELIYVGVEPSYRTYGLCLQAIAHRLTLPCPYRFRPNMLDEASKMCSEMLDDMWNRRVPLTSVNFDLVLRVFKETSHRTTFEKLLKVGYGIDLAFPDGPPSEIQGWKILTGGAKALQNRPWKPLPFSTGALNTLIDMLGKTKQISRMVMAFEVFTNPISAPVSTLDPVFYQFSFPESAAPPYQPPSAIPNTTSFNLLIRYAAKAKHAVFARHYVVQAMERDREVNARLRSDLSSKPLQDISSPNFAVNRGTFLPPFGLANRTKHFAFLNWGLKQASLAWGRKKEDLAFYSQWQRTHIEDAKTQLPDGEIEGSTVPSIPESSHPTVDRTHDGPSSSATSPTSASTSPTSRTPVIPELSEALRVDLDAPPPSPDVTRKTLDLKLHISLLTRDVEEMGDLVKRMLEAKQRLSQRIKERLGRRVWQGKDIFLMSHNARVRVERKDWTQLVRFRNPRPEQYWNPRDGGAPGRNREETPHAHPQTRRRRLP